MPITINGSGTIGGISVGGLPDGIFDTDTLATSSVTTTKTSFTGDLAFNSGYGSAATAYGCRAWVNFNGTGTVAIRESGNVSSITDHSTGNYTVNFSSALVDENYSAVCGYKASSAGTYVVNIVSQSSSAIRHSFLNYTNGAALDQSIVNVAVFR